MSDTQRQTSSVRTFPLAAEVKPRGSKGMADSLVARQNSQSPMFGQQLMEEVCERRNLQLALKRVRQNGGAPGVDGMSVSDLREHLNKIVESEKLNKNQFQTFLTSQAFQSYTITQSVAKEDS